MPIAVQGGRVWNMTQSVQLVTQRTLLREAWSGALHRNVGAWVNFRDELRAQTCSHHSIDGHLRARWPLYLSLTLPEWSPIEWRGIIGSRIMATLLPQLEACGFYPRPLCVDRPGYLVLLWPADATWTGNAACNLTSPRRQRALLDGPRTHRQRCICPCGSD